MFHMNNHIFSHTSVKFFGALLLNADFIPSVLCSVQMSCTLFAVHMEAPVYTVSCQVLSRVVALVWLKVLFCFAFFPAVLQCSDKLQVCHVLTFETCRPVSLGLWVFWECGFTSLLGWWPSWQKYFLIWTYHLSSTLSVASADTTCHGERVFLDSPSTVCCCCYHLHNLLLGA